MSARHLPWSSCVYLGVPSLERHERSRRRRGTTVLRLPFGVVVVVSGDPDPGAPAGVEVGEAKKWWVENDGGSFGDTLVYRK